MMGHRETWLSIVVALAAMSLLHGMIDPTSARAFLAASKTSSFTKAARLAAMTQSGVSQHVARIESALGARVFERSSNGLRLTTEGEVLRRYLEETGTRYEQLLERVRKERSELDGLVRYAMPASCALSPHLARLLERRQAEFPNVSLDIRVCDSIEVQRLVLEDEVDFGFITTKASARALLSRPYCLEEYVLVSRDAIGDVSLEHLRRRSWIQYPGAADVFDAWARSHFPRARIRWDDLSIAASANDLRCAITLAEEAVGCCVLAKHVVLEQLASRRLIVHSPSSARATHLIERIVRADRALPARVRAVIDGFDAVVGPEERCGSKPRARTSGKR